MRRTFLILTAVLLLSSPAFSSAEAEAEAGAEAHPFKISEDLDKTLKAGLGELYNLNIEKALEIFDSVKDQAPEHPMVAFGIASAHWWYLSAFVLENDAEESQPFLAAIEECRRLSLEKIAAGDPTGEAHLTLGGGEGLLGRWEATTQHWMAAYKRGKKAYRHLKDALRINPELVDAKMGMGIFDYYVATLPAIVRVLAFLGMGGDPSVGLKELHEAAEKSTYARTPSQLFLADIYARSENKPAKALEILQQVKAEYPQSPFIHMLTIIALYNQGKLGELNSEAFSFLEKVNDGTFPPKYLVQAHFALGATYFRSRAWETALHHFELALEKGTVKDPFFTWAHLHKGYVLDVMGKREEAVAEYREVLNEIRRWGSHENAKVRLKRRFKGTDKELAKLHL